MSQELRTFALGSDVRCSYERSERAHVATDKLVKKNSASRSGSLDQKKAQAGNLDKDM